MTIPPLPPGLAVELSPLFAWPDDPAAWLRHALRRETDGPALARAVRAEDRETVLGWPLSLFEAEVNGEIRIVALYRFLEWGGAVLVRGPLDERSRSVLLEALVAARPDFGTDEAICLSDLLPGAHEGEPRP